MYSHVCIHIYGDLSTPSMCHNRHLDSTYLYPIYFSLSHPISQYTFACSNFYIFMSIFAVSKSSIIFNFGTLIFHITFFFRKLLTFIFSSLKIFFKQFFKNLDLYFLAFRILSFKMVRYFFLKIS